MQLRINISFIQLDNFEWFSYFSASSNPDDDAEVINTGNQPGFQPGYQPTPSIPSIPAVPQYPFIPTIPVPSVPIYPSYPYPSYPTYPTYFPLGWTYSIFDGFSSKFLNLNAFFFLFFLLEILMKLFLCNRSIQQYSKRRDRCVVSHSITSSSDQ